MSGMRTAFWPGLSLPATATPDFSSSAGVKGPSHPIPSTAQPTMVYCIPGPMQMGTNTGNLGSFGHGLQNTGLAVNQPAAWWQAQQGSHTSPPYPASFASSGAVFSAPSGTGSVGGMTQRGHEPVPSTSDDIPATEDGASSLAEVTEDTPTHVTANKGSLGRRKRNGDEANESGGIPLSPAGALDVLRAAGESLKMIATQSSPISSSEDPDVVVFSASQLPKLRAIIVDLIEAKGVLTRQASLYGVGRSPSWLIQRSRTGTCERCITLCLPCDPRTNTKKNTVACQQCAKVRTRCSLTGRPSGATQNNRTRAKRSMRGITDRETGVDQDS